jgi:RNA polymerase sigma-70 factor (ECF subfamily)
MADAIPPELAPARERFHALVATIRPELHRYCARLTGSIVDGEDVVQETLGKAFYALTMSTEVPPLRPWLFRIAHNTAVDFLRRSERRQHESLDDLSVADETDVPADPELARAALRTFLALPIRQRSAVILKDVLGQPLDAIAASMGTTVPAVKAALVRGRATLRANAATATTTDPHPAPPSAEDRALLARYVALFNARDWPGLEAMLADDVQLDLVSQATRRGPGVAQYFGRYRNVPDLRAELGEVDGRDAIHVYAPAASSRPTYFILIDWHAGQVANIRDYRYVPYAGDDL